MLQLVMRQQLPIMLRLHYLHLQVLRPVLLLACPLLVLLLFFFLGPFQSDWRSAKAHNVKY